mgnify:CR=1 FL=1
MSLRYTETANAAIINALSPVVSALVGAVLIQEWLRFRHYLGTGLCVVGVLILLCDGQPKNLFHGDLNRGDLLMLAAVISWCVYGVIVKRMSSVYSSYLLTFYATVFGLVCLLLWVPMDETAKLLLAARPETIYALLYMGFLGSGIGYLTYNFSVRYIGPTRTSSFVYSVVPIFVAVLAWCLLGQQITVVMSLSAVLILAGLGLMMTRCSRISC